jgi:hypothetical protein
MDLSAHGWDWKPLRPNRQLENASKSGGVEWSGDKCSRFKERIGINVTRIEVLGKKTLLCKFQPLIEGILRVSYQAAL